MDLIQLMHRKILLLICLGGIPLIIQ